MHRSPIPGLFLFTLLLPVLKVFPQKETRVAISVTSLEKSCRFFVDVLGFTKKNRFVIPNGEAQFLFHTRDSLLWMEGVTLALSDESVDLLLVHGSGRGRKIPKDAKSNDHWFQHIAIVVSNMDSAYAILRKAGVEHISSSPQTLPAYIPAAAGIRAFYFRDPDGHSLEIIYYPPGKGRPRWQERKKLFLGIDHTALVAADSRSSVAFYQALGYSVSGTSENYGTEQEHLNQVFGARVLITGLSAQKRMGIELLQYIAPPGGRSYPSDTRPSDLVYWHTAIWVSDLRKTLRLLHKQGYHILSSAILSDKYFRGSSDSGEFLARDPDGHFVLVYH